MEAPTIKFKDLYAMNLAWWPETVLQLEWRCDDKPRGEMEAYDAKERFGDERVFSFEGRKVTFDLTYEDERKWFDEREK